VRAWHAAGAYKPPEVEALLPEETQDDLYRLRYHPRGYRGAEYVVFAEFCQVCA
jgi:hypothetical protein